MHDGSVLPHVSWQRMCARARSLQGVMKALVGIARTMSQNSADDLVRSLLSLDNAYAIDECKWESRWNTQLAPLARRASLEYPTMPLAGSLKVFCAPAHRVGI